MNQSLLMTTIVSSLLILFGCAHNHSVDGPQARSEIPEGIRVGIGGKEISEGDTLAVYRDVCRKVFRNRAGYLNECKRQKAGEAIVLKVLDHDSAVVQPKDNLQMDKSMTVEKEQKEEK